jgi:hypothetical protein
LFYFGKVLKKKKSMRGLKMGNRWKTGEWIKCGSRLFKSTLPPPSSAAGTPPGAIFLGITTTDYPLPKTGLKERINDQI